QVTSAIKGMEAGHDKFRRVADVVKPRGALDEIGLIPKEWSQGPSLPSDALDMRPSTGQRRFEQRAGDFARPVNLCHKARLGGQARASTDAGGASGDVPCRGRP